MKTQTQIDLNEFAQTVHKANTKWWQNIDTGEPIERNKKELLMLVISELAEAMEGERKNLMDDKLPHRKMAEVEMADAYIRLMDFSAGFKLTLRNDIRALQQLVCENKAEFLFNICTIVTVFPDYGNDGKCVSLILSMIQEYCTKHGYDLHGAIAEKMAFNATRQDHTHEARRIAGGKQF